MGLTKYKEKRSFDQTPEPKGKVHKAKGKLRFVVQKHHASHLHYDFRLEMEGVLKSWAVPKGPSMNPSDKRLAMMVEDHPYDYRDFEGIIPKGNYGAGTVIVWDEGTYELAKELPGQKGEKGLLAQLHQGNLHIIMNGQKLKGEFVLVKSHREDMENGWLLIKVKDEYATKKDITKEDRSVQSGKTLEEVKATSNNEWESNRKKENGKGNTKNEIQNTKKERQKTKNEIRNTTDEIQNAEGKSKKDLIAILKKKGKKQAMPASIKPMLATLTDEPFDDDNWIFEVKWDGYRAIANIKGGAVSLYSRNLLSFNTKFKPITDALKAVEYNVILDGEIIALNDKGDVDFQQLQAWQKTGEGTLVYYVFDLVWLEGYSVTELPLLERKELLQQILPQHDAIKYSDHIESRGKDFFEVAGTKGLEGIMAKEKNSTYLINNRSKNWLKIKTNQRQEAVIAGYTEGRGGRKHFGSLILGIYENGKLQYIGHTGSGFNDKSLAELHKKLEKIGTETCPFEKKPKTQMPARWVKPELVCEVKFQEWTRDGSMRHPIFMGLRQDKKAKEVSREKEVPVEEAKKEGEKIEAENSKQKTVAEKKTAKKAATNQKESAAENQKKTAAAAKKPAKKAATKKSASTKTKIMDPKGRFDPSLKEVELTINKKKITFTNLSKIYWKKEKITKGDMLNYYDRMGEFMLPYMKNRPQSLNRHPDGIDGKNFYQKNVKGKVPDWVETYEYTSESDGEKKEFYVCTDHASLLYIANLGCIEMNPWHSRVESPENPDWCVIDLDPGEISFEKVIEAAQVVREVLDGLGIPSYPKTSGSTGIHIYIPLGAKYDYDQSRQLAELVVTLVHDRIPGFTSLERSPSKRKDKIYLDYLQNRTIQTIAAPYSLRPKPGATVSTPLFWEEVKKGLKISDFTMFTIFDRLKETGDIFTPVLKKGIDLEKTLQKAASFLKAGGS